MYTFKQFQTVTRGGVSNVRSNVDINTMVMPPTDEVPR